LAVTDFLDWSEVKYGDRIQDKYFDVAGHVGLDRLEGSGTEDIWPC
jgi:hypothetical protein